MKTNYLAIIETTSSDILFKLNIENSSEWKRISSETLSSKIEVYSRGNSRTTNDSRFS